MAPPTCYLEYTRTRLNQQIAVSSQNCYKAEKGAFTGDVRSVVQQVVHGKDENMNSMSLVNPSHYIL